MEDDEEDDEVLEEEDDGWEQEEEEEEEEEQNPFQKDHVDVTNFLYLFNRRVSKQSISKEVYLTPQTHPILCMFSLRGRASDLFTMTVQLHGII